MLLNLFLLPILLAVQYAGGIPVAGVRRTDVNETGFTHGCDRACQRECISTINTYRANHDAPAVRFDQRLADQAQALIEKGMFKHSDWVQLKGGEAFAWGSLFPSFTAAIKSWHDEGVFFNYDTGQAREPQQVVLHFAQLIWKKTRKVGCARGKLYGEPWYVVHYDHASTLGERHSKENVGRPKQDDGHWFRNRAPFSAQFEIPQEI